MLPSKFLIQVFEAGKTTNGYGCWVPVRQVSFFTRKKTMAYFDDCKSQIFMSVLAVYVHEGSKPGSELCDMIASNLN